MQIQLSSAAQFMNAERLAQFAQQTQFREELRQASVKREERAGMTAACLAGLAIGAVISAVYFAAPFLGVHL